MRIYPITELEANLTKISYYCKKYGKPVFLTKEGEGYLVVMDINDFTFREETLVNREKALEARFGQCAEKMNTIPKKLKTFIGMTSC